MNITTSDLKTENWDEDVYWDGDDLIFELKDKTVRFKNCFIKSLSYDLEYDNDICRVGSKVKFGTDEAFNNWMRT